MKPQIQVGELSLLHRVVRLSHRDRMRSMSIQEELIVNVMLLLMKKSHVWFRYMAGMLDVSL